MFNYKIVAPFVVGVVFYASAASAQYNEARECWFKKRVDAAFGHHHSHYHKAMEHESHEKSMLHHKHQHKHKHKHKHHKDASKASEMPLNKAKPAVEEHNEHSDKR